MIVHYSHRYVVLAALPTIIILFYLIVSNGVDATRFIKIHRNSKHKLNVVRLHNDDDSVKRLKKESAALSGCSGIQTTSKKRPGILLGSAPSENNYVTKTSRLHIKAGLTEITKSCSPSLSFKNNTQDASSNNWSPQCQSDPSNLESIGLTTEYFTSIGDIERKHVYYLNHSNLVYYSFLGQNEEKLRRKEQHEAIATIAPYCSHQTADSSWLRCDVKNGQYVYKGGSYGVAIFGSIINDGNHGIRLYKNSNMKSAKGSITEIDFRTENLIPFSSTPLPIVIKLNTQETEINNAKGLMPEATAIDKEVRRSRIATAYRFPQGSQLIPDLYDVQIIRTGQAHPLYTNAYIQERLLGDTVHGVLIGLIGIQKRSMFDNLNRLLERFQQYLNSVKAERAKGIHSHLRSSSKAYKAFHSAPYRRGFLNTFERAKKELWLRARLRLTLPSLVYAGVLGMWNNMIHCDSHWSNVFLKHTIIRTPEELKQAKKNGETIILGIHVYMSDTVGISALESKALERGITVYNLQIDNIRWIDTANILPVKPILDDISRTKGTSDPSQYLYGACSIYREKMPEDFVELKREGADIALGQREFNYTHLYNLAKFSLTRKEKRHRGTAKLYKLYTNSLPYYRSNTLQSSALAVAGELPYIDVWNELFAALTSLDHEIEVLDSIFLTALRRLTNLPQIEACTKARYYASKRQSQLQQIIRKQHPWSHSLEVVGTGCSLADMRNGVNAVRKILQDAASSFPSYASVVLL